MDITLTKREASLILDALRIAKKDGSIYGAATIWIEQDSIDAEIEAIELKLKG